MAIIGWRMGMEEATSLRIWVIRVTVGGKRVFLILF
jgi:hypothetical protein